MQALVVNIGNELLQGQVVNGNGAYIAGELKSVGIEVQGIFCIADGAEPLRSAFSSLPTGLDLVVCTGGLGPTPDDTTRYDVASYFNLELDYHPEVEERIRLWNQERNRPHRPENRVQAIFPRGAQILSNPNGTADGFMIQSGGIFYAFMPGVPSEMGAMLVEQLIPRLPQSKSKWFRREIVSWGIGEDLQTKLLEKVEFPPEILFASLPSPDGLLLRISTQGNDAKICESLLDQKFVEIQTAFAEHRDDVVSWEGLKLPEQVILMLANQSQTLAVAESCTGGGMGSALTRVSGSSEVFLGGVIAYSNAVKAKSLGIDPAVIDQYSAVSAEVALAMAKGVVNHIGSDWGVSITGIAGPQGGTPEKPVGTVWIGVAGPNVETAIKMQWRGSREQIRQRSVFGALNELRKAMLLAER